MKVVQVNTYDVLGGAARAAFRLHEALNRIGTDSWMWVRRKVSDDPKVRVQASRSSKLIAYAAPHLDALPLRLYPRRVAAPWSVGWMPTEMIRGIRSAHADILNLHWIGNGALSISQLAALNRPIVWTLHDMWPFTGGCHYSQSCAGFLDRCGACPQLGSTRERDLSRRIWNQKRSSYEKLRLTVVSPSRWLAERARESSLFANLRVETIPNGLDLRRFKPVDRDLARDLLDLPRGKKLILFGAMSSTSDPRKGFQFLQPALRALAAQGFSDIAELIVIGASEPQAPPDLGLKTRYLGTLSDDVALALMYSAADVFVAPSVQDNLPNTVLEALACGRPTVAFDIGGMPDLIEHRKTGYLAKPFDTRDLASGIAWVLGEDARWTSFVRCARTKAESEFELDAVARRYRSLYEEILSATSTEDVKPGSGDRRRGRRRFGAGNQPENRGVG